MARRKTVRLTGINTVMRNLNRQLVKIKSRTVPGMIAAADVVRKDMDRTPPLIPVDTGRLRASWFVRTQGGPNPLVVMGFSADYAMIVHETFKNYRRPGSGAKFFESSVRRNTDEMIFTIAVFASIK